jgi:hypothetical protein
MDGEDIDRRRPAWAVKFSVTMLALNPGVRVLIRWLTGVMALVTVWRLPEALAWLR